MISAKNSLKVDESKKNDENICGHCNFMSNTIARNKISEAIGKKIKNSNFNHD